MRRREFVAAALAVPVAPALARDVARLVPAPRDAIRIASPNGSVEFELRHAVGPRLSYGVTFRNQRVIEPSPLGIVVDGVDLGQGVEAGTVETYYGNERYPWRGVHAEAINRFKGARIAVRHTASATDYLVEVRVFDDGIGFRCVVPSEGSRVPDEATAVVIPAHAAARGDDRPRSECTRELRHRAQPLAAAGAASLPQGASYRLDQARPSGLEVPGRRRRKHARDHERVLAARGRTGFRIQPGGRLLAAMERKSMVAWSQHDTTIPFTRMLAGHLDFTPMLFGERRRETSWAHQIATAALFTAPLLVYGAHPKTILEHPAAELIRSIPSVWDETRVLPFSEIGEVAAFARRHGKRWFVVIANGPTARSVEVPLSFLGGGSREALLVRDAIDDPAAVRVEHATLRWEDDLTIDLRSGGGFVARL